MNPTKFTKVKTEKVKHKVLKSRDQPGGYR